jgi:hypothetical protein
MTDETMVQDFDKSPDRIGTTFSVIGLSVWLAAMMLAVISPIAGLPVPPMAVIGLVIFSGLFSLLSLPRLLGSSARDSGADADPHG